MKLSDIALDQVLTKDLIHIDLHTPDKDAVINFLSQRLIEEGVISNKATFIEDVYAREEEGTTGIGHGIAIPHGKSQAVLKTCITVARLEEPIEWESLDDEPVKIVILFAVRDIDANTTHIRLLQKIAMLLADDDRLEALKFAQTKDQIYDLLTQEEE